MITFGKVKEGRSADPQHDDRKGNDALFGQPNVLVPFPGILQFLFTGALVRGAVDDVDAVDDDFNNHLAQRVDCVADQQDSCENSKINSTRNIFFFFLVPIMA